MNILLTGGSGLVGSKLSKRLIENGHEVRILTREKNIEHPFYHWDKNKVDEKAFENLDGIIHLAGATISKRWTKSYKKEIYESRINTANLLYTYAEKLTPNLKFFISASGSSYYGQITSDTIFKEEDSPGNDFLGKVCIDWENAAYQFKAFKTRVVCLRTSLVLAKEGGAFDLLKKPIKMCVGANLGDGKQWMPWIHVDDLVEMYVETVEQEQMNGSFNADVPEKINHSTFNETLARKMNKPFFMPNIPSALLRIVLGEMSDLILKGSRLSSEKIERTGFVFKYPTLEKALDNLLK
jgi:uncharacterized protein (TIGR01777 family)